MCRFLAALPVGAGKVGVLGGLLHDSILHRARFLVVVSVPHYSANSAHVVRPAARLSSAFFEVREKCFCARYGIRRGIRTFARIIFALSLAFCAESQRQADPGKNTQNRAKEPTSSKIGVAPTSGPRAARFLRVPGQPNRCLATMI